MTVLQSPEAMIVICTVILIAYTAHVLDKAFASSEQFEAMLKARERIMGLQAENAKLRELVEDMLDCIQIRAAFGRPPTEEMYEMFYKRARELGVDE